MQTLWQVLRYRVRTRLTMLCISGSAGADSVRNPSLRDGQRRKDAVGVADVEQHPFRNLPHHLLQQLRFLM
jgi:hypothetical protein